MVRNVVLSLVIGLFSISCMFAQRQYNQQQDQDEEKWTERIVYGGGGTARFGTITIAGASPYIGYRVTDRFIPGINFHYLYFNNRLNNFSDSRYGTGIFARYFISESVFAHVESEWMNTSVILPGTFPHKRERQWVNSFMVGGGFFQPVGRRSGIMVTALYILNHNPDTSPYGNAPYVLRAGVMF